MESLFPATATGGAITVTVSELVAAGQGPAGSFVVSVNIIVPLVMEGV